MLKFCPEVIKSEHNTFAWRGPLGGNCRFCKLKAVSSANQELTNDHYVLAWPKLPAMLISALSQCTSIRAVIQ